MRWRAVTVALCAALIVVGSLAALAGHDASARDRSPQHVEGQQVEDLSATDQADVVRIALDEGEFASHLPVLSVRTGGTGTEGAATLDVFDAHGAANRPSGEATLTTGCLLSPESAPAGEGEKASYALDLTGADGTAEPQGLLGMEPATSWRLDGMSGDETRLRAYLALSLAAGMTGDFVPDARYCELFVDGGYRGLYLLEETPTVGEGRIDLTTASHDATRTSYVVEVGDSRARGEATTDFLEYTLRSGSPLVVTYPQGDELTEERLGYVRDDVSAIEKALYSYDYDTMDYGYWRYLDVDSFVSCYVLNEFVSNEGFLSDATFLYKDVEGKLALGTALDYDEACGQADVEGLHLTESTWYYMLLKDETFCEQVIGAYRELRAGALSDDSLSSLVEGTSAYLEPALARDRARWPEASGQTSGTEPSSSGQTAEGLRDFALSRAAWLDRYIDNLRQYSHESMVKKFNH